MAQPPPPPPPPPRGPSGSSPAPQGQAAGARAPRDRPHGAERAHREGAVGAQTGRGAPRQPPVAMGAGSPSTAQHRAAQRGTTERRVGHRAAQRGTTRQHSTAQWQHREAQHDNRRCPIAVRPGSRLLVWRPGQEDRAHSGRPHSAPGSPPPSPAPGRPESPCPHSGADSSGGHRVGVEGPEATLAPLLAAIGFGTRLSRGRTGSTGGGERDRMGIPPVRELRVVRRWRGRS